MIFAKRPGFGLQYAACLLPLPIYIMPIGGAILLTVTSAFIAPFFISRGAAVGLVKTGWIAAGSWLTFAVLLQVGITGSYLKVLSANVGMIVSGIGMLCFGVNLAYAIALAMGGWFVTKTRATDE